MSRFNFRKSKTTTPETTPEAVDSKHLSLDETIDKYKKEARSQRAFQLFTNLLAAYSGFLAYSIASEAETIDTTDKLGIITFVGATALNLYSGTRLSALARTNEGVVSQLTAQSELNNINAQTAPTRLPSTNPLELDI